jgi:hypothetical protein
MDNIQNETLHKRVLQSFENPDKDFLNDKECLICLESMRLVSMDQLVKLPCGCANSAYHILCIIQLLQSGENNNFCPHCKTKYALVLEPGFSGQQAVPHPIYQNNLLLRQAEARQAQQFSHIMTIHLLSNTTMNIINLCVIRSYPKYNTQSLLPVLFMFYFLKIFLNFCIFLYSKSDIYKIEVALVFSYGYQTIVFGWLAFALSNMKSKTFSTILLMNNLLLGLADFVLRLTVEYRMTNSVDE